MLKDIIEFDRVYRVTDIARDLAGTLAAIAAHRPGLALIDIHLGGNATGIEVAAKTLRSRHPDALFDRQPLALPGPRTGARLPVQALHLLQRRRSPCASSNKSSAATPSTMTSPSNSNSTEPRPEALAPHPTPFACSGSAARPSTIGALRTRSLAMPLYALDDIGPTLGDGSVGGAVGRPDRRRPARRPRERLVRRGDPRRQYADPDRRGIAISRTARSATATPARR